MTARYPSLLEKYDLDDIEKGLKQLPIELHDLRPSYFKLLDMIILTDLTVDHKQIA